MGYLAKTGDRDFENMKQAVIAGSVIASFTVEKFGLERLRILSDNEITERIESFRRICCF